MGLKTVLPARLGKPMSLAVEKIPKLFAAGVVALARTSTDSPTGLTLFKRKKYRVFGTRPLAVQLVTPATTTSLTTAVENVDEVERSNT